MFGQNGYVVMAMSMLVMMSCILCGCASPSNLLETERGPIVTLPSSARAQAMPVTATATASPTTTTMPTATYTPTKSPTCTPTSTQTTSPLRMEVRVLPLLFVQGQTGELFVRTSLPSVVTATLRGAEIGLQNEDGLAHWLLFGVEAVAEIGDQAFRVAAVSSGGQAVSLDGQIRVVDGDYDSETIIFTPQTSTLLEPEVTEPELERLAEVFGAESTPRRWSGVWSWPFDGPITSEFGTRRDYGGVFDSYHSGIDIDGVTGDVIHAAASGTVVLAETLDVRGNAVIIDHGAGVFSGYYHLDRIDVIVGQSVITGDVVGIMGSTGLSTGSHLHWEVRVHGVAVNPQQWTEQVFPGSGMEVSQE